LATLPRCASAVSVAVQALQNAKLKIREQVPIFNCRLLHLRCATAVALGLIAASYLPRSDDKIGCADCSEISKISEIREFSEFSEFFRYIP